MMPTRVGVFVVCMSKHAMEVYKLFINRYITANKPWWDVMRFDRKCNSMLHYCYNMTRSVPHHREHGNPKLRTTAQLSALEKSHRLQGFCIRQEINEKKVHLKS